MARSREDEAILTESEDLHYIKEAKRQYEDALSDLNDCDPIAEFGDVQLILQRINKSVKNLEEYEEYLSELAGSKLI